VKGVSIITMRREFWEGFFTGIAEMETKKRVFHRSKRAPMVSSERSRPRAEGPRDTSCGKPGVAGFVPVGLLINAYLNAPFVFDNTTAGLIVYR